MAAVGAPPQPAAGLVVGLESEAARCAATAGAKAAVLARLLAAGFPVPPGVVVGTAAFAAWAAAAESHRPALPPGLADELRRALATLGEGPFAVRSSSRAEDLPGASAAGQYATVLGARGVDEVTDAVRTCWSSAASPHVRSYLATRGLSEQPMAVLIQPLLPAQAAGVAFTANPVTGARDEVVVSAVRGLGERLVSGAVSPDEWLVRGGTAICRAAPEQALDEAGVLAVAGLATRVAEHLGAPQDVEWALAGGRLHLLQARPVTTLDATDPLEIADVAAPPGFWQRLDTHYPRPLSPWTRSLLLPAANDGFRRMCDEFGLLLETVEEREIGGWVYLRSVPLGGREPRPVPPWLTSVLVRVLPALRTRVRACAEAERADRAGGWVRRWHDRLRAELEAELAELRGGELQDLCDRELDRHLEAAAALLGHSQTTHMLLNQSINLILAELALTCRELLGWGEERTFELLAGLSETSSAPARELARLADRVRRNPEIGRALDAAGDGDPTVLLAADEGFAAAFAAYLDAYGFRTLRYEAAEPTLGETPQLVVALLRDQVRRGWDPDHDAAALAGRRRTAAAAARARLAARGAAERERFERTLARAEAAYPVREEHGFYDTMVPLALLRRAALEVARRLVERGQLEQGEDVFLLEIGEARRALAEGGDRRPLVRRRRRERARVLAHPGPPSHGRAPSVAPSFTGLPPVVRRVHEATSWAADQVFAAGRTAAPPEAGVLRGIAASPGTFTGPVRVIRDESEFGRLRAGDVVVCPITSPVWSVLFPSVGALVTDTGGLLSHSAIIAREYRIPAVVAVGVATSALRDGQRVTVDGTAGTVTVHHDQPSS